MRHSQREVMAAHKLGEALLEFLVAVEEGSTLRAPAPKPVPEQPSRMASNTPPGLLTAREAARYLGVSAGTLFNHTAPRGHIRSIRIGAAVRYSKADLDAAIESFR
jgi:excisionase family DNA binding protein